MTGDTPSLEIDKTNLHDEAPTPANGDPYVAVVMETDDQGVAINKEAITLGTGFESIDDIAWDLKQRIEESDQCDHDIDIDFTPDRAEVFGIAGSVNFSHFLEEREYTVELRGETYTVESDNELDARYLAASEHKAKMDGPFVGTSISEFAQSATITNTETAESA